MTKDTLLYYMSTMHRFTGVPLLYGNADRQMYRYQPFQLDGIENTLDFIAERMQKVTARYRKEKVLYLLHPSMVMLGMVVNHETGEFVFVGPMASNAAKEEGIAEYLFEAGLPVDATRKLSSYLNATKNWTPGMLKELLVNINAVLNHEMLSTEEITILADPETKVRSEFTRSRLQSETEVQRKDAAYIEEYTANLNHCVQNGDLIGLADLITKLGAVPYDEPASISLREEKINAFGSIFALESQAIQAGVPGSSLETTKKFYLTRIDEATSVAVIHQMTVSAMFDFTKHVKTYLTDKTADPIVNRVINYIKENVHAKLLCEEIAASLHISPHYLFRHFKAATGMTVNAYIHQEKIRKACYYMMFTDRSLADIATHLSFSSQSYFQAVFRKTMGQTPSEWKRGNKVF